MKSAAHKTDVNQKRIVTALRRIGAIVFVTSNVGKGFPNIVVGYHGQNFLIEIKSDERKLTGEGLTPEQKEFFAVWRGQASIVKTVDEALAVVVGFKSSIKNEHHADND